MTIFDNIFSQAIGIVNQIAGEQITITKGTGGDAVSITVNATPGQTTFTFTDENGIYQREDRKDYIVAVADMVTDEYMTPLDPDDITTITKTVGATTYTYYLQAPNREPFWRYVDTAETYYRLHCLQNNIS